MYTSRLWQKDIHPFEQLTTRIGPLRIRRCGSTPVLAILVAYASTSNYEEELEAFYMNLGKFYKEDHTFYKVIVGDFNAKSGPRRTSGELHTEHWKRLYKFVVTTKTIHGNSQFQKPSSVFGHESRPVEGTENDHMNRQ